MLLTRKQAAEKLNITDHVLKKLEGDGLILRARKLGGRYYYHGKQLEESVNRLFGIGVNSTEVDEKCWDEILEE